MGWAEFENVPQAEMDSMNEVKDLLAADKSSSKVNLAPGTYRDESGKPWLLPSFKIASQRLLDDSKQDHEYLSLTGLASYIDAARDIIFGDCWDYSKVASIQTAGGTGAVHLGAEFLRSYSSTPDKALISKPSWVNHHAVFQHVGWKTGDYTYYDRQNSLLDFNGMVRNLEAAESGSVIVLHAVGHNPTGCDLSEEQWESLAKLFARKKHFAFLDCAYQGFVSGDLDRDRRSIEIFAKAKTPMCICQSFSKNAGLYGERLGALHFLAGSERARDRILAQLKAMTRREISCAPRHGADLVARVYHDAELRSMWEADLKHMVDRVRAMRQALHDRLATKRTPGKWGCILEQQGLFTFAPLSEDQCWRLIREHHIYLAPSGRMMMAGLNEHNLDYVAEAIDKVVIRE